MEFRLAILPFLAVLTALCTGCAPRPVPPDATPDWTLKNGITWFWQQELDAGCVDWMAQERWVNARVLVDAPCGERSDGAFRDAKGLSYSSSFDEIAIQGYWEWSKKIYSDQIVYDAEGNWIGTKPCPHELTQAQIAELQTVVTQAIAQNRTAHERAVLARIAERLKSTNGRELGSSQFGCSLRPDDPDWSDVTLRPDPWTDK
ncbi:MAG TPA: hypothetical protein VLA50_05850 [Erythrobacter sp.]|nr:hypothetical protein [Erythrobacter sp.]